MCNPVAIQAAVAVVSAVATSRQQSQQADYQEGVARFNARQQENEAQKLRAAGVEQELEQRRATAELLARQRAQIAASGVALGTGSALAIQEDTATLGEVDALRIRSSFEERASTLDVQSGLTLSEGEAAQAAARSAGITTALGAAGQVIGSGVADKFFTPKSAAVTRAPGLGGR